MSRRSNGLVGIWAEVQRQQQRQQEAQPGAAGSSGVRNGSSGPSAGRWRGCTVSSRPRTGSSGRPTRGGVPRSWTRGSVAAGVAGRRVPGAGVPDRAARPRRADRAVRARAAGVSAVRCPIRTSYQAQGGWARRRPAGPGAGEARARFEQDWQAAQAAEAQRQQQLAAYRRQYEQWAEARWVRSVRHNAGVAEMAAGAARRATRRRWWSTSPPRCTPPRRGRRASPGRWRPPTTRRPGSWCWTGSCPGTAVVPEAKSSGTCPAPTRRRRPPGRSAQRRALYREVLAQCVLLVLRDLFAADAFGALESVALNGFVDDVDPATGAGPGSSWRRSWPPAPPSTGSVWNRSARWTA